MVMTLQQLPREDIIRVFRKQGYLSSVPKYGSRVCYVTQKRASFNYRRGRGRNLS